MLDLTLMKMDPFLPQMTADQRSKVVAWIPVLQLLLNARYGDRITTEPIGGNEVAFVSAAADAVSRRLTKPSALVDSQAIGPANVRYNQRAHLAKWFLPEELSELDGLAGLSSIRTVRTPAPDAIRFGNRMRTEEDF